MTTDVQMQTGRGSFASFLHLHGRMQLCVVADGPTRIRPSNRVVRMLNEL